MLERMPEHARRVLDLAREEADGLGHRYLGPEHVVLGVRRDPTSRAAQLLRARGVELDAARAELRRLAGRGVVPQRGQRRTPAAGSATRLVRGSHRMRRPTPLRRCRGVRAMSRRVTPQAGDAGSVLRASGPPTM